MTREEYLFVENPKGFRSYRKTKNLILLRIRFLSGATRNRMFKFKILNYSTLYLLKNLRTTESAMCLIHVIR